MHHLQVLPREVLELRGALRNLDASHNRLQELPTDIAAFTSLQRLVSSDTKTTSCLLDKAETKYC